MMGTGYIIVDTIYGGHVIRLQEYSAQSHIFCHILIHINGLYHNIDIYGVDGVDDVWC
jgi:hypothetical protein